MGQLAWMVGSDNAPVPLCLPLGRSPVIRPCPHGSYGASEAAGGDRLRESQPLSSIHSLGNAGALLAPELQSSSACAV